MSQCRSNELRLVRLHFWVAKATATGCRVIVMKNDPGKSAWRNRVRTRLGGDFSIRTGLSRSQWDAQSEKMRRALSGETSGESSVSRALGSKPKRPGPP